MKWLSICTPRIISTSVRLCLWVVSLCIDEPCRLLCRAWWVTDDFNYHYQGQKGKRSNMWPLRDVLQPLQSVFPSHIIVITPDRRTVTSSCIYRLSPPAVSCVYRSSVVSFSTWQLARSFLNTAWNGMYTAVRIYSSVTNLPYKTATMTLIVKLLISYLWILLYGTIVSLFSHCRCSLCMI